MDVSKPERIFERVVCVNLKRRGDRWADFLNHLPADWPFANVKRYEAIDSKCVKPPGWWTSGAPAWGCYSSHLRIIEDCLNRGIKSVLLMEDDAICCEDFRAQVLDFLAHVPANWQMIYLGGQNLRVDRHPPKKINDWVYQPWNVNRTHAFAIQGDMLRIVYKHLLRRDWLKGNHIDHHLGRLHQRREHRIYIPGKWLIGQAESYSNIKGKKKPTLFWPAAETAAGGAEAARTVPFVAVVGLHSSGSSCLAGVLHHLGVHLGNKLIGYYGNDPDKSCGFEAVQLAKICEDAIPFPSTKYAQKRGTIYWRLFRWINQKRREAHARQTIAGGKYPMLCRLGDQLRSVCGDKLKLIAIDRPIEESIQSLIRRCPKRNPANLRAHQEWLDTGKTDLLAQVDHLRVNYADLLSDPNAQIQRILDYLDLKPTDDQRQRAANYVDPDKRHCRVGQSEAPPHQNPAVTEPDPDSQVIGGARPHPTPTERRVGQSEAPPHQNPAVA